MSVGPKCIPHHPHRVAVWLCMSDLMTCPQLFARNSLINGANFMTQLFPKRLKVSQVAAVVCALKKVAGLPAPCSKLSFGASQTGHICYPFPSALCQLNKGCSL